MIDPEFQEIERHRERIDEERGDVGRIRCPRCGSDDVSDRQGHIRPEGNEQPPYLMVCEECGTEWDDEN